VAATPITAEESPAVLEVASDDTAGGQPDGHSELLAWRHRYTGTLSYYRCWTPGPVPLSRLIAIAVARWRIEEDHQSTKQSTGLDAEQIIRWKSWHRWTVILATPPPAPRPPSPSTLECLRRDNTMITTNCSCLPGRTSTGVGSRFDQLCARGTSEPEPVARESLCKL
jgi:hypothetical protein